MKKKTKRDGVEVLYEYSQEKRVCVFCPKMEGGVPAVAERVVQDHPGSTHADLVKQGGPDENRWFEFRVVYPVPERGQDLDLAPDGDPCAVYFDCQSPGHDQDKSYTRMRIVPRSSTVDDLVGVALSVMNDPKTDRLAVIRIEIQD